MKRGNLSTLQRAKIFTTHGGKCHLCDAKIDGVREKWEADHIIPLAMGGDDNEANMAPAHVKCHRTKTDKDVKAIAKAKRIEAKHNGARKPSTFQSRGFGKWQPNIKFINQEDATE